MRGAPIHVEYRRLRRVALGRRMRGARVVHCLAQSRFGHQCAIGLILVKERGALLAHHVLVAVLALPKVPTAAAPTEAPPMQSWPHALPSRTSLTRTPSSAQRPPAQAHARTTARGGRLAKAVGGRSDALAHPQSLAGQPTRSPVSTRGVVESHSVPYGACAIGNAPGISRNPRSIALPSPTVASAAGPDGWSWAERITSLIALSNAKYVWLSLRRWRPRTRTGRSAACVRVQRGHTSALTRRAAGAHASHSPRGSGAVPSATLAWRPAARVAAERRVRERER